MNVPVRLRGEITADFQALPNEAAREEALRLLAKLKTKPLLGSELGIHPEIGDLSDCRKIYFDEDPNVSPRLRIVYRVLPDATRPREVEIVGIGRRANFAAYREAIRRLNRDTG